MSVVDSDEPLLIVADSYRMAVEYAREHDLGPGRNAGEGLTWIYVDRPSQVHGRRYGRYVVVTTGALTGRNLDERLEVLALLRCAGFIEQES